MEIFLIYIFTLIFAFSTLGYGFLTSKFLKIRFNNIGLYGVLGLFLLSILSSYSHLLFPHNYIHNLFFIFFGLLFFLIPVIGKVGDLLLKKAKLKEQNKK